MSLFLVKGSPKRSASSKREPWPALFLSDAIAYRFSLQTVLNRQYQALGFGKLFRIDRLVNQRYGRNPYLAWLLGETGELLESLNASQSAPA